MAWVTQEFRFKDLLVILMEEGIAIDDYPDSGGDRVNLFPSTQEEAHAWALMLRRAARRLEEIGKGLA